MLVCGVLSRPGQSRGSNTFVWTAKAEEEVAVVLGLEADVVGVELADDDVTVALTHDRFAFWTAIDPPTPPPIPAATMTTMRAIVRI